MPLNATTLSSEIEKALQAELKKMFPDAKKEPAQKVMSKAVAEGVVKGVKAGKGKGSSGPPAAGKGKGIKGLKEASMTSTAMKEMKKANGATGSAQKVFFKGIFTAIVKHLEKNTSLTSPFGGPITKFNGITQSGIFNNIKKMLPSSYLSSKSGKSLFNAIAKAVADEISKKGKGTVPPAGGTPGPVLAKIS
jgi:hypothetical protein